jgi:hypothetical protein
MTRTRRLASATLLGLLVSSAVVALGAGPAQADPPVTMPDSARLFPGNAAEVEPLENDSDPDGDELAVCRVADSPYKKVSLLSAGDSLLFLTSPRVRPGTYTFTYYACDFETLVPGTITLTVVEPPRITAKALPRQPGKIKIKNRADFKIRFLYGDFDEEEPDGIVKLVKNSSVTISVRRTKIDWVAYSARGFEFLGQGHVRGIELPPGTTPPASGRPVSPRIADLWHR